MVVETPITVSEISNDFLRTKIVDNGCCGEKELIKFYAYTLVEHRVAVHLDLDCLITGSLDDLFDDIIQGKKDALYTYDYNMVNPGKQPGVQGGFIVIKPSIEAFEEYNQIVLTESFAPGKGWGGSGVGGFWGGMTFQGLVPYFYKHKHPGRGGEINRCRYNNMADNPKNKDGVCREPDKDGKLVTECEDCRAKDYEDVRSVHFTICQKPWICFQPSASLPYGKICNEFHRMWFETRRDFEETVTNTYSTEAYGGKLREGFCKGGGEKNYIGFPNLVDL
jgi:hypothetical protein